VLPLNFFDITILMCGMTELQVAAYTAFGAMNMCKVTLLACHTKLKYTFVLW
jgi:hypothetical protein